MNVKKVVKMCQITKPHRSSSFHLPYRKCTRHFPGSFLSYMLRVVAKAHLEKGGVVEVRYEQQIGKKQDFNVVIIKRTFLNFWARRGAMFWGFC